VILGFQPEDIKVYLEPKENTYLAQLVLIEKVGKYTILSLNWQGQILKAVIERDSISQHKRERLLKKYLLARINTDKERMHTDISTGTSR
jgi:ABC-type sugar transport system ATPase subunit